MAIRVQILADMRGEPLERFPMAGTFSKTPNRAKQKLLAGEAIAVLDPDHPDPSLVEYLGAFGVDAVLFDMALRSTDVQTLEDMRRAADAAGLNTIVRPATDAPWLLTRYINRGVGGIHIPHVATAAQAARVVATVRHTLTHNGVVAGRIENFLTVVGVDSMVAMENLDAMLRVEGVDVFFVGPRELSNSMGGAARKEGVRHPDVVATAYRAIDRIRAAGRIAGTTMEIADAQTLRRRGVRYICEHLNRLIAAPVRAFVDDAATQPR